MSPTDEEGKSKVTGKALKYCMIKPKAVHPIGASTHSPAAAIATPPPRPQHHHPRPRHHKPGPVYGQPAIMLRLLTPPTATTTAAATLTSMTLATGVLSALSTLLSPSSNNSQLVIPQPLMQIPLLPHKLHNCCRSPKSYFSYKPHIPRNLRNLCRLRTLFKPHKLRS